MRAVASVRAYSSPTLGSLSSLGANLTTVRAYGTLIVKEKSQMAKKRVCKFGKVKRGKRKGQCLKHKRARKRR